MNEADREILIRVDQKVKNIEAALFESPKYPTIKEKVLNHDKVFWITLGASITAVIKSFWK